MSGDFLDDLGRDESSAGPGCGPHCPGNRIPLTPYEVARLARGLGVTTGEVIRGYLQEGSPLLAVKEDGSCVFHRSEGCEQHVERPLSCRSFLDPTEGAARFLERARQYRDVLKAWKATRRASEPGAAHPTDLPGETRIPHPAPELGMWILDVDSLVADRCRERGVQIPEDLESRIDVHLEALRAVLDG